LGGAWSSATTLGGVALRSMTVTVSGGGLAGTEFTPSTRMALPSLAERASCPLAPDDTEISAASDSAPSPNTWQCMRTSHWARLLWYCDLAAAPARIPS